MLGNRKLAILYIEDDKIDRLSFQRFVEKEKLPLDYQMAVSISDARDILKDHSFDIILTDFLLSDGNALDILDEVFDTPVLVLTGEGTEEVAVQCMRAGARDYLIKDPGRKYLRILPLTLNNIARQQQAEQERKLFESVFENANDGIVIAGKTSDDKLIIKHINEAFCNNLRCSPQDYIGNPLSDVYCNDINVQKKRFLENAVAHNKPVKFECKHTFGDESHIWLEANMVPMKTERGHTSHWLAINRDITDRKKKQKELVEARREAEQARIEKERFLVNMNHEVRTPLNGILGMVQLLEKSDIIQNSSEYEYVESIRSSSNRLMSLLNNVLDYSRIISGEKDLEPVSFSFKKLLDDAERSLNRIAESKNLTVNFNRNELVPETIVADPVALNQIILNLGNNAIKFTGEGYVQISIMAKSTEESRQVILEVLIEDTGIGIEKENLDQILKGFAQVEHSLVRNFEGAGLGLTISHKLVELMDGKLEIKSNPDVGTTVFVSIPVHLGEKEQNNISNKLPDITQSGKKSNILLVEDNKINRKVIRNLLSGLPINITETDNGNKALEKLKQTRYDAVLMDVQLPDINGIELTQKIRGGHTHPENKQILIIGISATNSNVVISQCHQAGMNHYITKPFEPDTLISALSKYIDIAGKEKKSIRQSQSLSSGNGAKTLVNLSYLERMIGNSEELKQQLMGIFLNQTPIMLEEIQNALNRHDWETLSSRVHKLKTSINYMGISSLKPIVKRLENLDNKSKYSKHIEQDVEILLAKCRQAKAEIQHLM